MATCVESEVPAVLLASGSPRRRELLSIFGIDPVVLPTEIDETPRPHEPADQLVERLAREKAIAGWNTWLARQHGTDASARAIDAGESRRSGWMVVAADTVVEIDGSVLGKPEDEAAAKAMLEQLSGAAHRVFSGVAVGFAADPDGRNQSPLEPASSVAVTTVVMRYFDPETISWYIQTGEPMDKAGAYGIQGQGSILVDHIQGSYPNVVGLPLTTVDDLSRSLGWPLHTLGTVHDGPTVKAVG